MLNSNFSMPVAPVCNNGGMFGGDGWWAIIIFALIFGWGGFGGYGNANGGVADNYVLASDFANIQRQIDSATSDLKSQGVQIANGLSSLGYDQLAQMNGINQNISNTGFGIQNAIQADTVANMQNANALQAQLSQCCCENREAIANLNYNLATQSCETKQAIANSTKSIIDFLTQDKIASLTSENAALKAAANNAAQTYQIVSQLKAPTPVPAYQVPNPFNSCGCCAYN